MTIRRTVSVEDVDAVPDESRIGLTVNAVEEQITSQHVARIRIELTNEAEDKQTLDPRVFGQQASDESGLAGVLLVRAPDEQNPPPKCESADEVDWAPHGFKPVVFEPDESKTQDYLLFDDPRTDGCFPPGEYRFEEKYTVPSDENETPLSSFVWGFTLRVEESS